jgi:hypothetical protein
MNCAAAMPCTEHEAAMPTSILGVIFYDLTLQDHGSNFGCSDLPCWPGQLSDCVRKKENPLVCCISNLIFYFVGVYVHDRLLSGLLINVKVR